MVCTSSVNGHGGLEEFVALRNTAKTGACVCSWMRTSPTGEWITNANNANPRHCTPSSSVWVPGNNRLVNLGQLSRYVMGRYHGLCFLWHSDGRSRFDMRVAFCPVKGNWGIIVLQLFMNIYKKFSAFSYQLMLWIFSWVEIKYH